MNANRLNSTAILALLGLCFSVQSSYAAVSVQCPGDTNGDAVIDSPDPLHPNAKCLHLAAGDGFITMADGYPLYIFSFSNVTGTPAEDVLTVGNLNANFSAPTLVFDQGDEVYLNLTNVAFEMRPDLADPHTVHYHGFPEAASVFDGVPEASISIAEAATLTYYYLQQEPGTYMYHCHVEATEHMQMGMLGNLYVKPAQNKLAPGTNLNGFTHQAGYQYAYNDGDGSTFYDVEFPIQLGSLDHNFHDASLGVQPLPFANMRDTYPVINGRGYPDTADPRTTTFPAPVENGGKPSQQVSSLITAAAGQKVLLRLSNLNVTNIYTLRALGLPMKVVGRGARLLRGPDGKDLSYMTDSVTVAPGEGIDVIIDTAGIPPGNYFLYTTNMNYLSNNEDDFGGMMTEIVINPVI